VTNSNQGTKPGVEAREEGAGEGGRTKAGTRGKLAVENRGKSKNGKHRKAGN